MTQDINQRIAALDIMRGFALCGIIFANLMSFTGFYSLSLPQIEALAWWDRLVLFGIDFLIEGKFYSVFATLLGAGFAMQYARYQQKQQTIGRYWRRRMSVLLLIGLCHMYLIWHGDILTLYALLGMTLLLFIRLNNTQLLASIIILLILPLPIHMLLAMTSELGFWQLLSNVVLGLKQSLGYADMSLLQLRTSTNPIEVFWGNVFSAIPRSMSYLKTGRPFQVLGQFLLGIYLVRLYINNSAPLKPPGKKAIIALLGTGLILNLIYAYIKAITGSPFSLNSLGLFQGLVYHSGAMILALGYMALIYRLCQSGRALWLNKLALLGRMSLTMYLIQTSLCVLIFYGYGFSLMGKVPFVSIVIFGTSILLLQYRLGKWWLQHFNQGPMERLWRLAATPVDNKGASDCRVKC
jgi:uncharacterized protein